MGIEESVQRIENDGMGVGNRVAMGDGGTSDWELGKRDEGIGTEGGRG